MTSRRTSRAGQAILGFLLSALLAAEPVLAGVSQGALWDQRHEALAARLDRPTILPAAPIPSADIEDVLRASPGRAAAARSPRESKRTLVLIQDVHMNAEAQENIRVTVDKLLSSGAVAFVALEGASGDIDLSLRDRGVSPAVLRHAADYLLRTGRISGAVHALLCAGGARAHGVETAALYDANVRAAIRGRALLPATERALSRLRVLLDEREKQTFNPRLRRFVERLRTAKSGRGVTPALADLLLAGATDGDDAVQLARFSEAAALEKAFDAERLESERRRMMEILLPALGDADRAGLLALAMSFRAGHASQADLFHSIETLSRSHGLAMGDFPALRAHLRYLDLADTLDVERVSSEAASLKRRRLARLASSEAERRLLDAADWLDTALKLVRFGLTREEWNAYDDARAGTPAVFAGAAPDLSPYENFYRLASARDTSLAREVERLFRESRGGAGVLVAGGFHAGGLGHAFAGDSRVITFTPRLTRDPGEPGAYFSVFTRERTPLDRLLDGQKLFLANPPARVGILPELILLGEERADPESPLDNPTARLGVLRGGAADPVTSRDTWPSGAELSSHMGTFTAAYNDAGDLLDLTFASKRAPGDAFPNVEREIRILPSGDGSPAPAIDDVYGPLFLRAQQWADVNKPNAPVLLLMRTIDMRARTILLRKIEKDPRLPVAVYAAEAARLRRFFPGYRIIAENLQGIGAAKGMLREYSEVSAERFALLPGYPVAETPFVSFQRSVADAERAAAARARRYIDYTMGPYSYHVTALVPAARPEDFEFLETFLPLRFLRAHRGNLLQQSVRAVGIFGIWAAMLVGPPAIAYLVPAIGLKVAVVTIAYVQLGAALAMARSDAQRPLTPRQKAFLFFAYALNAGAHRAYNAVFRFAPLTIDAMEAAFRAWASTVRGQSIATTKAQLQTTFGFTDYRVRQLLKEFNITAGSKQKSPGRKDLEAWAKPRAGTVITETTAELALRHHISTDLVLIVLDENRIAPVGKQLSDGRKNLEAWAATMRGRTFISTRIGLVTRFKTNLTTLVAVLKEFEVKLLNPGWAAARKKRKAFDTWAKKRAGRTLTQSATALADKRGIAYRYVKASLDRHGVITPHDEKSPERVRLETWAAERRGQTVPESRTQLELDFDLSFPTIAEVLTEFSITPTREPHRYWPRHTDVDRSLGAYLQPFEGKSIRFTPEQLALRFKIEISLVNAMLTSLNIQTPAGGSLMTPETRARYAEETGRDPDGARARLLYAPDREFLQTFRPLTFLSGHPGSRRQQTARALGIAAIWLAMIGTPLAIAYFSPDVFVRGLVIGFGGAQFALAYAIARLDAHLRLPVEIKAGLFLIYLPNVITHSLYNLLVRFAPLNLAPEPADEFVRRTIQAELNRLRIAFANDPDSEERAQRTLAHLWLSPISNDDAGLAVWAVALGRAVDEVISEDIPLTELGRLHELRLLAREGLDDMYLRPRVRLPSNRREPFDDPESAKYLVNDITREGTGINVAVISPTDPSGVRLVYEVRDGIMIIIEIQKQGRPASLPPALTERLLDMTIAAARAAGLTAVRLPTAGEVTDHFNGIPAFAAHRNYARLPWERAFRLEVRPSLVTTWKRGRQTAPLTWELKLAPESPGKEETAAERIARELASVDGVLYYPAGGSDWKPFKDFLPRMPRITKAIYADREYGDYFPHSLYHKEERARALLRQEGFAVRELPGLRSPDHVHVFDSAQRSWRVEYYRGDIVANTLGEIMTPQRLARYGGVGYIHVERPGEGASLAVGKNSAPFHATLIDQLNVGGILGGYQRPAEEPFEFLQDHYDLIGLERLGKDADGNAFLKKVRPVDRAVVVRMIELDRALRALYWRVEYPYGSSWGTHDHAELIATLATLRADGHDALARSIQARFEEKFQVQIRTHGYHPDFFAMPMARMVLFTLLMAIGFETGLTWEEPLFRVLMLGTGIVELAVMLSMVLNQFFRTRARAREKATALESRARVLVRAARALSTPGGAISDELLQSAVADAAQSLGAASRTASARSAAVRFDWATSFSDAGFPAVLDRVMREEGVRRLDPAAARAVVKTLSGWGLPVDTSALVRAHVVVKITGRADLARVAELEQRLPAAMILLWADAGTAASLSSDGLRWPLSVHGADVFAGGRMKLARASDNLPENIRIHPEDLVFVLPAGITVDDAGLPPGSAWRNVRLLVIDQVLGLLKVMTMQQRLIIDRVADHLIAARQA